MKKIFFLTLLTSYTLLNSSLFAYDIPQLSIGLRTGAEAHLSTTPLLALTKNADCDVAATGWGANAGIGLVFDVKTRPWFSISTQVTMGIARFLTDELTGVQGTWHDFNFDVLAKFHVGMWFFGIGPGFSLSTPPVYRTRNNHINSNVGNLGDSIEDLGLEPRVSTRFTTTVETGVYIPITSSKVKVGYVTVSIRSTIAPMTFEKIVHLTQTQSKDVRTHYLDLLANRSSTLATSGIFIGYNYILN